MFNAPVFRNKSRYNSLQISNGTIKQNDGIVGNNRRTIDNSNISIFLARTNRLDVP